MRFWPSLTSSRPVVVEQDRLMGAITQVFPHVPLPTVLGQEANRYGVMGAYLSRSADSVLSPTGGWWRQRQRPLGSQADSLDREFRPFAWMTGDRPSLFPSLSAFNFKAASPPENASPLADLFSPVEAPLTSAGLSFVFNAPVETPAFVLDAFRAAGEIWSAVLTDDITVQINLSYGSIAPGALAMALPTRFKVNYAVVRPLLGADALSLEDRVAIAHLPQGPEVAMVLNHTLENGGTQGYYLDDNGSRNNQKITLTSANAKALIGDWALGSVIDGRILVNSDVVWDGIQSDGIEPGAYDLVGAAVHEIGHIMGYISSVDQLDTLAGVNLDWLFSENFYAPTPLDLFRYSEASAALGAIDFTADPREKFFSIDGGATASGIFSTGTFQGSGDQASHWLDQFPKAGLMGPTLATGELGRLTALDLLAFDVIGWDLA